MEEQLTDLRKEFREFRADMSRFKADMTGFKADMTGFKADMTAFRAETIVQFESTNRQMRVLHEEVLSRIALMQEGRSPNGRWRKRKS